MNNFIQRTLTGAVFVTVLIGSILINPVSFFILFFLLTVFSVLEFYKLIATDELKPQVITGVAISAILFLCFTYFSQQYIRANFVADIKIVTSFPVVLALLFALVFIIELYRKTTKPFMNIALTLTGILYVAIPFSLLSAMGFIADETESYNPHIVLGFFFLLWTSDTGAYLTGMKFGRHKLFERISPKKTWEGSIGGTVAALLVAYLISNYYTELALHQWLIVALIIVVFGTLGDLTESMLKRSLNIKDSGTILPGHGGLLDRFDGLLGAAPFVFFYLMMEGKL